MSITVCATMCEFVGIQTAVFTFAPKCVVFVKKHPLN